MAVSVSRNQERDFLLNNQEAGLSMREWLPLAGMTCAAFLFNTSEFMPIGLLSAIAEDFAMTEAEIGRIVSIYAWVVMVLSMPLMVWASRYGLRALILSTLGVFILSNSLASLANDFWTLLGARLVLACAHAIYWSIATPAAVRLVEPKFKAIAMSMLVAGSSLAVILGLPVGRIIGLQLGWRMSFFVMAAVAVVILLYMAVVFPKLPKTEPFSFRQLPELLHNKVLMGLYGVNILVPMSQYTAYSYIEPFMKQVGGMSDNMITTALMMLGFAGMAGSMLFARLYERCSRYYLAGTILGLAASLMALHPLSGSEYLLLPLIVLWGIFMTSYGMASQAEVLQATTLSSAPVAMSIYSGIFNFGIGGGTWAGGVICTELSMAYIGYGGAVFALLGFGVSLWLLSTKNFSTK